MLIDADRLGLTPYQQLQIDAVFLDTTLDALTQKSHYRDRAFFLTSSPDLADELEAIHTRVYDHAHAEAAESEQLGKFTPEVITSLGKLAFIDSLSLPSSEKVVDWKPRALTLGLTEKTIVTGNTNVERALGDWDNYRRLFRGLFHTVIK